MHLCICCSLITNYRIAGNFRGIQFSRKGSLQRFRDLIFEDSRSLWLRPQGQRAPQSNVYIPRSDRAQSSAWTLHCIARRLETAYERRFQHRSCSTTNWCEVAVVPITPRAPASQRLWPRPVLIAHAFDFLFRGFNFRGSTVIRENRENWIPRKFPAIRYSTTCMVSVL